MNLLSRLIVHDYCVTCYLMGVRSDCRLFCDPYLFCDPQFSELILMVFKTFTILNLEHAIIIYNLLIYSITCDFFEVCV